MGCKAITIDTRNDTVLTPIWLSDGYSVKRFTRKRAFILTKMCFRFQ